jgi:hypothetical protein
MVYVRIFLFLFLFVFVTHLSLSLSKYHIKKIWCIFFQQLASTVKDGGGDIYIYIYIYKYIAFFILFCLIHVKASCMQLNASPRS